MVAVKDRENRTEMMVVGKKGLTLARQPLPLAWGGYSPKGGAAVAGTTMRMYTVPRTEGQVKGFYNLSPEGLVTDLLALGAG